MVNCIFNNYNFPHWKGEKKEKFSCKENNHARKYGFTSQKCQYSGVTCHLKEDNTQLGNEEWKMFVFIQNSLKNNTNLTRILLYYLNSQRRLNCFLKAHSLSCLCQLQGTRKYLNLLLAALGTHSNYSKACYLPGMWPLGSLYFYRAKNLSTPNIIDSWISSGWWLRIFFLTRNF